MFIKFNENPCGKTTGDCVIRAISTVENKPWRKVYLALCVEGYEECTFGDDNKTWEKYLKSIGYRRFNLSSTPGYKLSTFAESHKEGKYIVGTGTHVVAVINGDIIDAWDSSDESPLYYFSKTEEGGEE